MLHRSKILKKFALRTCRETLTFDKPHCVLTIAQPIVRLRVVSPTPRNFHLLVNGNTLMSAWDEMVFSPSNPFPAEYVDSGLLAVEIDDNVAPHYTLEVDYLTLSDDQKTAIRAVEPDVIWAPNHVLFSSGSAAVLVTAASSKIPRIL